MVLSPAKRFETHFVSLIFLRIPRFGRNELHRSDWSESAGCEIVTSNWGALPETLGPYGMKFEFSKDMSKNAMGLSKWWMLRSDVLDSRGDTSKTEMSLYAARDSDGDFGLARGTNEQWIRLSGLMPELEEIPQRGDFKSKKQYAESLYLGKEKSWEVRSTSASLYERARRFSSKFRSGDCSWMMKILVGDSMSSVDISLQGFDLLESVITSDSSFRPLPRRRGGSIMRCGCCSWCVLVRCVRVFLWEQHTHIISQVQSTTFC